MPTFNFWTSRKTKGFLGIAAHFLNKGHVHPCTHAQAHMYEVYNLDVRTPAQLQFLIDKHDHLVETYLYVTHGTGQQPVVYHR